MNKLSRLLTAVAFTCAGFAAHANAAVEQHSCHSGSCFQLTPLVNADDLVVENGASRTPQSLWLESQNA